jgi:ABC-type glutathione transport system ATPase component
MSQLLRVNELSVKVAATGQVLLQGAGFALDAGERLTIVGESGAGKSLLAQAIMGTLPRELVCGGEVFIQGTPAHGQRAKTQPLWGRALSLLPQEPWLSLNPLMRVLPQVAEGARSQGARMLAPAAATHAARERLQSLGLAHTERHWLHQLSGGMAQRVALAATEMTGAPLLIADEPTKGLDPSLSGDVAALLHGHASERQALLTITHDLDLARALGGRLVVMRHGQIVESGPAARVLDAPTHIYTRALVAAQPKHWPQQVSPITLTEPVISASGLSKRYGSQTLFTSLSLSLAPGEVLAVTGASGCGKSTLGNILLGLVQPDQGHVTRRADIARERFQKLYQDPPAAFAPTCCIGDALRDLAARHALSMDAMPAMLERLGLHTGLLHRLPSQVSGGELQRLALLRLMLLKPAFIVADEPTSRLDLITQRETMQMLIEAASEQGSALMLITHDAEIARAAAHRQMAL